MNNSIKNRKIKNFKLNDLSSTSTEFLSLTDNKSKKYQKGGSNCQCQKIFQAFTNNNIELALYIINEKKCCLKCQNNEGNTVLHSLVQYCSDNTECNETINDILSNDCSEFINIQNNEGQTPMLLAVMNDNNELAEKMELCGADKSIKDINGNYIQSEAEDDEEDELEKNIIISEENKESLNKNVINIFNVILDNKNNPELSSLNLNKSTDTINIDDTDDFMNVIKTRLEPDLLNNNEEDDDSSSSSYIELPEYKTESDSLNTDKFISLLDNNRKPLGIVNYSEIEDTDEFITLLRDKYSSSKNDNSNKQNVIVPKSTNNVIVPKSTNNVIVPKSTNNVIVPKPTDNVITTKPVIFKNLTLPNKSILTESDTSSVNLDSNNSLVDETTSDIFNQKINKPTSDITPKKSELESETSDLNTSLNTKAKELANETTSDITPKKSELESETSDLNTSLNTKAKELANETTSDINPKKQEPTPESETSDLNTSLDTKAKELANETTSDINSKQESEGNKENTSKSKYNIFLKNKNNLDSKIISTSEVDTNTLLKAIKKIQNKIKYESSLDNQVGGAKKQKIMGYRNLNYDSDVNNTSNLDYDLLYNSDSEFGNKKNNNELSRMMASQKEKIHQEVLDMIMGLLNKGLLLQSNEPIEPSERNAKLIKAFIYRHISEKNPQMGGMDKILSFKTMNESDIINLVKKMPKLDELEKNIQKHLEEKNKSKSQEKNTMDISETTESDDNSKKESKLKKESKVKDSKAKKTSKKSSKK